VTAVFAGCFTEQWMLCVHRTFPCCSIYQQLHYATVNKSICWQYQLRYVNKPRFSCLWGFH